MALREILIEIQDYIMPKLDSYEQMLYHYLFRHTYLIGKNEATIGTRSIQTRLGFGIGKAGSPPSQRIVSQKVRSLEKKGCIKVISRSAQGTKLKVLLPKEIPGIIPVKQKEADTSIEELDFFNDSDRRLSLFRRDNHKCFYCYSEISEENYAIDHVISQASNGDNSYMNLVACCWDCNSVKQDTDAADFLRKLKRKNEISGEEFQERLEALELLKSGKLVPDVE